MNDRELLEMAAKAAGHDYKVHHVGGNDYAISIPGHPSRFWNPLNHDGDALRLAVTLEIVLSFDRAQEVSASRPGDGWEYPEEWAEHNGDRNAATRRAIVRAAAGVGSHHE